jgi:multiple sugar transport system substrate-binding protein
MSMQTKAWVFGAAMLAASAAHAAPTQVEVWYTLNDANKTEFEKLVTQYNKEQADVQVKGRAFPTQQALRQAAVAAVASKKTPNLIQLDDNHSPEVVAEYKAIKPFYELLAKYPIKDAQWFLPGATSFTRDAKGRLLAFPYFAEIPVMFYNVDQYKKAGLNPQQPARTWKELQDQLLKLRDKAESDCPLAASNQVEVFLESLAPINNQAYATNGNGMDKSKTPTTLDFDMLYVRHISLMTTWKRSILLVQHTDDDSPDAAFAKGTCSVVMTDSSALGNFINARGLQFGVAPLPYYEDSTSTPGRPFVSGSALWVMEGHPAAEDKATAEFLAWLSKPVVAAEWHQHTGYLPLTEAAFRASDVSFYNKVPGAQLVVASMRNAPNATSKGFRMSNYERIEPVLSEQLNQALDGKVPPIAALNNASQRAQGITGQK